MRCHRSPSTATLEDLTDGFYAAALDGGPAVWEESLQRLADAFGADSAYLVPHAGETSWEPGVSVTARVDPVWPRSYAERYGALDPVTPRAFNARGLDKAVFAREIMDFSVHTRTEFYQEWCRPQDVADTMFGFVAPGRAAHDDTWGLLALIRGARAEPFDQDDQRRVEVLLPHLRRAVSMSLRLGMAVAEHDALVAAVDRLAPRGALLVDAGGRVLFASAAAEAMLATPGLPLARTRRGLLMTSPRASAAARAELARLMALASGAGGRAREGGSARLPAASPGAPPLALEVLPFGGAKAFSSALALVLIDVAPARPAAVLPVLSAEFLRERWGLTPAEVEAALLLAKRGTGSKALARELGVSPATVRTHLQRALEKTDTHSRAALVALLLQGADEPR